MKKFLMLVLMVGMLVGSAFSSSLSKEEIYALLESKGGLEELKYVLPEFKGDLKELKEGEYRIIVSSDTDLIVEIDGVVYVISLED